MDKINNENIKNFLENHLDILKRKYSIQCDIDFSVNLSNKDHISEYNHYDNIIKINPESFTMGYKLIMQLYHEFRHAYQYKNYPEYFIWWLKDSNKKLYDYFYDSPINLIEEDARIFGYTLGKFNSEFLFSNYEINFFKMLDKHDIEKRKQILINENEKFQTSVFQECSQYLKD